MVFGTINSGGAKPQDLSGYLKTELLGKAGGVAPLDEQAKISLDYLYTNAANALAKLDASGKLPANLIPTLSAYIAASAKGAANGVASLDATGKLPSGQLTEHSHAYSSLTGIPSTFTPASHSHAAGEITGLAAYLAGLGYSNTISAGSYIGDGTGKTDASTYNYGYTDWTSPRIVELPFAPTRLLLFYGKTMVALPQDNYLYSKEFGHGTTSSIAVAYLTGNKLYTVGSYYGISAYQSAFGANESGITYPWIAVA